MEAKAGKCSATGTRGSLVRRRRTGKMGAPDDAIEVAVGPEGLQLVAVGRADDDQVSPGVMDRLSSEDLPEQHPSHTFVDKVRLGIGMSTEVGRRPALAVPQFHDHGVCVLGPHDGEHGTVAVDRDRVEVVPQGTTVALHVEGAPEAPVRGEDGDAPAGRGPGDDRVAGPPSHPGEVVELAGSLARASPGREVGSTRVECPQLLGARVDHHDPSVAQSRGISGTVEQVGFLAIDLADRERRLRPDPPIQTGALGGTGVLDDADAGAVAKLGAGPSGLCAAVLACEGDEDAERRGGDERAGNAGLHD